MDYKLNLDHEKNGHINKRNREARRRKRSTVEVNELGVWDTLSCGNGRTTQKAFTVSYISLI